MSPNTNGGDTFAIDSTVIVDFVARLVQVTLGATREELEKAGSLFSPDLKSHTLQKCSRFALENQVALYVTKDLASSGGLDGISGTSGRLGCHAGRSHGLMIL